VRVPLSVAAAVLLYTSATGQPGLPGAVSGGV